MTPASETVPATEVENVSKTTGYQALDHDEFREYGSRMIHYVAQYASTIGERRVFPAVQPGYLNSMIPKEAPEDPESWEEIFRDVDRVIMPGVTHWHHPNFHAYFPTGMSYPSICADILSGGIGCVGFTWASSPACTELEVVIMDWLAKLLFLPEAFLSGGKGGGVIQGTASEATLIALLAARNRSVDRYRNEHPDATPFEAASKMVGYYSDQAHSSVERAGLISMMRLRPIQTDSSREMRGKALQAAIEEDVKNGLIPFFCTATLGTTSSCAFDNLKEIGPICEKYDIWLHIDAAYAGSAFICPEFRHYLDGSEYADSFVFNPHKWLLVNFDCSCMWFKNVEWLIKSFSVDPIYLQHKHQGKAPDFRHWHIPLGRRFRSLKLWFVLRRYGVRGLQEHIRNHVALAKYFEQLLQQDKRFEVVNNVTLGLVCFRLKNDNEKTRLFYQQIEKDGRIHVVPSEFSQPESIYFIRFAICYHSANRAHMESAFKVICEVADQLEVQTSNEVN